MIGIDEVVVMYLRLIQRAEAAERSAKEADQRLHEVEKEGDERAAEGAKMEARIVELQAEIAALRSGDRRPTRIALKAREVS